MSLITTPAAPAPTQAALSQLASSAAYQFSLLLTAWKRNLDAVWANTKATPQAVITAMGTDAKNNFAASAATGAYLATVSPLIFDPTTDAANQAAITAAASVVKPYTVNTGGTITVNI